MKIAVDASELLQWAMGMGAAARVTKFNVARALNKLGGEIADSLADDFTVGTGFTASEVRRLFEIKKATAGDLAWELDAGKLMEVSPSRKTSAQRKGAADHGRFSQFPPGTLVDVITAGDVKVKIAAEGGQLAGTRLVEVCDICLQKEEDGPYSIEQIMAFGAKWSDFAPSSPGVTNLFHPNCRCTVWPTGKRSFGPRKPPPRNTRPAGPSVAGFDLSQKVRANFEVMVFDEFTKRMGSK
jgi:hypothetical protein